jgi:hypothetical protein
MNDAAPHADPRSLTPLMRKFLEWMKVTNRAPRTVTADASSSTPVEPQLHDSPSSGVQAHHAGLIALPVQHADRTGVGVQVFGLESQGFADA